jgi:hypothetical protein
LELNHRPIETTLAEALNGSRVVGFVDDAKRQVEERFQLIPDEVENVDIFWHNAYKVKFHTAIPEAGYKTTVEWVDDDLSPGRNWYYLRVTQLNGQMAWSSPIWVDTD